MGDLYRKLSVGSLPKKESSLDHTIEMPHDTAYDGTEMIHTQEYLAQMLPFQQGRQAQEIQGTLEKLQHKLSADAHAARRSELRSKQRLAESLSQPPPPAGQLDVPQSRTVASGSSPERIPRPIVLTEILRGLRHPSQPETRLATAQPASPLNRTLSPRALHFSGVVPTPARGETVAVGPSDATVQRPNLHADQLHTSSHPTAATVKGSLSPDPLGRSRVGSSLPPEAKAAATNIAVGRSRQGPSARGEPTTTSPATSDTSPLQPHRALSPPQLQKLQQQKLQAPPQSRNQSFFPHRQEQQRQQKEQQQRPVYVELLTHRPQSTGRRYMSPGSAAMSAAGSGGGSSTARHGSSGGGGGGGGGVDRLASGGSKGVVPGTSSGISKATTGANFSSLNHILRGLGGTAGRNAVANPVTAAGHTNLPSSRSSSAGGAAGGVLGPNYPLSRIGGSQSGSQGSDEGTGYKGRGNAGSRYRGARPQSTGALSSARQGGLHSFPTPSAAPRRATLILASGGSAVAPIPRPRSAPRSTSRALTHLTLRASPSWASAAGAGTPVARWTTGPDSPPPNSRNLGVFSSGSQHALAPNGGLSRASPSTSLLPMNAPISQERSSSAAASAQTFRPSHPVSLQRQQPEPQQIQAPLSPADSIITASLFNHAAAAQRLQAQLLEDAIADGSSGNGRSPLSPTQVLATQSGVLVNSDGEDPPSLYEVGALGNPDTTSLAQRRQSSSPRHLEAGSSVRMVESLLRRSRAAVSSVAEGRSNEVRSWDVSTSNPRGPSKMSPPVVVPSPGAGVSRNSATASPSLLASVVQPSHAAFAPQAHLLHPFIVPSGPLWPSSGGIIGAGGSTLLPESWQHQYVSRSKTSSPQQSSPGAKQPSPRQSDGDVMGSAGVSPIRPQGLISAAGSSSRGSTAAAIASGSPERAAQGLQALLSFLQQKFELRRERRRAARALDGWRRAAVSNGGASGGGGRAVQSPPRLEALTADVFSASSTRQGRYESPRARASSPLESVIGPTTRLRSNTDRTGGSVQSTAATARSRVDGSLPYNSGLHGDRAPVASGDSALSPGAAIGVLKGSPMRHTDLSVSAATALHSSLPSPGPVQLQVPHQDQLRSFPNRQEVGVYWEGEREWQERIVQLERIKQLEDELELTRKKQGQVLRHQQQDQQDQQLQHLQQQLQHLQDQLVKQHLQQQEQLQKLQQRQQQEQQHVVRPLSSGALLRRANTGDNRAAAAASQPPRKATAAAPATTPTEAEGKPGPGLGGPEQAISAHRHREPSMLLPPPPVLIPLSSYGGVLHDNTTATVQTNAVNLVCLPTAAPVPPVALAIASPASSKAAFQDLHQMVGEMERLLIAMNDDVAGAAAAAAGVGHGSARIVGIQSGDGGGAKTGTQEQPVSGILRQRGSTFPLQSQLPQSPGLDGFIGTHTSGVNNHNAASQQRQPTATVVSGNRTGTARGSLEASFASAAAIPGTTKGGSISRGGGGGGASGSSQIGGAISRGNMSSNTIPGDVPVKGNFKAASVGGDTSGALQHSGFSGSGGGGNDASRITARKTVTSKSDLEHTWLDQKPEHLRTQPHGSGNAEVAVTAVVPGTPPATAVTAIAAAALLASAGRAHANAASATDAMSEQLLEMRASIRRIEQEMWGAAAATQSLARGAAMGAAAVGAKQMGSSVVRQHPHLVRQQAQPARPYETSPVIPRTAHGGNHVSNLGPPDGRSFASSGGADGRAGGVWSAAATSRVPARPPTVGSTAGVLAPAGKSDLCDDAKQSSPSASLHTTFSLHDAYLPRHSGFTTSGGDFMTTTPIPAVRTAITSGGGARRSNKACATENTRNGGRGGIPGSSGTEPWFAATAVAATTTNVNNRTPQRTPSSHAGTDIRAVPGPRPTSPSTPGITRHVDALEAQLLEELGELENALQKLKHNNGNSRTIGA